MTQERIVSMMEETRLFAPPHDATGRAWVASHEARQKLSQQAHDNPDAFWGERATQLLDWFSPWESVLDAQLGEDGSVPSISWFKGATLNAAYNCLDRHVKGNRRNKAALIWQGEPEEDVRVLTYQMLYDEVCRFAAVLRRYGVQKGDRVVLYMPMIPELAIAMLACARIGAVHAAVFAGFSSSSLQNRIADCGARVLITADAVLRAGRCIPLKHNVDEAVRHCPTIAHVLVVNRGNTQCTMKVGRDIWWDEAMADKTLNVDIPCVPMDAEDMLFILYTSGSTGQPKGVVHTTGGYLTYAAHTTQWVFDMQEDDIYWCTADIGWITGHSYGVYGPLALGATTLMFEGVPTWPSPDRFWHIIEKFKVSLFYTAPTVIRSLMRESASWVERHDLSSLRLLASVGEPINPDAWMWYHEHVGKGALPIIDTWWQTETGGIMIAALPYATSLKPGSATLALPGIDAAILAPDGTPTGINEGGHLIIRRPWPGMLRGVFGAPERFRSTYFERFAGMYESGDGARVDGDGYFWIMGRLDDVINVSGHRMGTAEIESALVSHPLVAEAAVVGMPHAVKGESIYAYVTLNADEEESEELRAELRTWVRKEIGPIATPEVLQFTESLPKTRSGKIMRRILRKVAAGSNDDFGDTSTLADASVVMSLVEGRIQLTGR